MKKLLVAVALFFACSTAFAQGISQACALAIFNHINSSPDLSTYPPNSDGAFAIAVLLNEPATPTFIGWRTAVPMVEVGKAINGAELAGRTTGDNTRLQTVVLISGGFINPSLPDQRAMFDDIFSGAGGQITRANLLALWKRAGSRAEKVCATGLGTDLSPGVFVFEGPISPQQVEAIRLMF